jgi:hypothetical protein
MDGQILEAIQRLTQSLAEQEARHQRELAAVYERLEQLSLLTATASATATPLPPSPPQRRAKSPVRKETRSEKLPDPPMFTGKSKDLRGFLVKLRAKLEMNADRFPTPRAQFLYAYSLLGGDAADIVEPLLDRDIGSVNQLIGFLETTYGDPNRRATAQAKLSKLKQKGSFNAHFSEFRRLAADAGFNESALVVQLKNSLTDELQRAMAGQTIPDSLNDYANLIARFDNDLRYLPKLKTYASAASPPPRTEKPQYEQTRKHPDAMEIDSASGYAPKGSSERQRRIREGLCFKCGSKNHISPQCKAPIPRSIRASSSSPPETTRRGRSSRLVTPHESTDSSRRSSRYSSRSSSRRSSRRSHGSKGNGKSRA